MPVKFPSNAEEFRVLIKDPAVKGVNRPEGTTVPQGLSLTCSHPSIQHWYFREGNRIAHYHECFDIDEDDS